MSQNHVSRMFALVFAIIFTGTPVLSQPDASSEEKSVYLDCGHKGLQFWDCDCVVREFRTARTANPDQSWHNLMGDIYNNKCFDETKIEHFYEKRCPKHNQRDAIFKKPPTDCACYSKLMAERILGRELKVLTHSGVVKIASEVRDQCR